MSSPAVSIVVPCYNSAASLPLLVQRLEPVLAGAASEYELLLVNDASRDRTWEVITDLAARYPWIRGICLMRNFGQHNTLLCGIRQAKFPIVVTLDDDLQNPPEEIPLLLAKLEEGYDVVYGTPARQQHGLWRNLASQITKLLLQKAMGSAAARSISAFRVFRTPLRDAFDTYRNPLVSIDVLLTWGTTRFAVCTVKHDPRTIGKSNYTLRKLVVHALNMVTGFSTLPLQLASWTGFAFTLLGLGLMTYVVLQALINGRQVAGFAFLASTISLFAGVQLFALGIFGEYLARIHLRTMERPSYVLRTTTG